MSDKLEILKKIRKVEAPEFLYTRILGSIENQPISKGWAWTTAACLSCIIALNVFAFTSQEKNSTQNDTYSMNTLNILYNE